MHADDDNHRIGLIGDPVEHSLSPAFQQPAFDALGLAIRYELWHTPADKLPERLNDIRAGRALGANVTVPHKEAAYALADDASDLARRAGAVNTIVVRDGRLYGDNTDIHGFLVPLQERSFPFADSTAVILGAGGAARGVAVALLDAGISRLVLLNRTAERARQVAVMLDDSRIEVGPLTDARDAATGAQLLVNATAIGWGGDELPASHAIFDATATGAIAYDLTYRDTPFLAAARQAGLTTIDGLAMLVHQGARSFELWTGQTAPVEVMWQAALRARAARTAGAS